MNVEFDKELNSWKPKTIEEFNWVIDHKKVGQEIISGEGLDKELDKEMREEAKKLEEVMKK